LNAPEGALNVTLHPILEIFQGGSHGPLTVVGLSTLKYVIDINAITLTATFDVTLGSVDLASTYEAEGWIDARPFRQVTLPSGNFTGSGPATLKATNVALKGSATLFINLIGNKVSVRVLNVDTLTFDSLAADLGTGYTIAGGPVDWAAWSATVKDNFRQDFDGALHNEIIEKVRTAANVVVGQFTLQELIDLINGGGEGGDGCPTPAP
jgi:hypothetical protein